ncbi:hypothetical protein H5410_006395 [Solanum commersonii]|uniref:Uncharacterized protein n=1 Tax=Solanum commersonii TaxID=4109 RepID=A0A9J6A9L4_SOLCO|nr:hypothetical protein H5410_006395 [Solanum commersonii]
MGTFEKLGLKQVVKTTKETITIDSDYQTFRLLSENNLAPYRNRYRFMHIGLVHVTFKPLTLRGLPESFIAALRNGRNHNWKKSLIGTIQTSLAYEPVYFNIYPNLHISLRDKNSLKFQEQRKRESINEDPTKVNDRGLFTFIKVPYGLTDRSIKILVSEPWISSLHDNVDKLLFKLNSNNKGKEKVANTSIQPHPKIEDFKIKDFSYLEKFLEKRFKGGNLKP